MPGKHKLFARWPRARGNNIQISLQGKGAEKNVQSMVFYQGRGVSEGRKNQTSILGSKKGQKWLKNSQKKHVKILFVCKKDQTADAFQICICMCGGM